jgi:fatty-acyl-CoA synthase
VSPYDRDLDRSPANHQPLTPLGFLERAAATFPERIAVVHGGLRRSYRDFYARARRLASALAARGIGRGDTVAAMLPNIPAQLECHYGVPMTGGVLNTLNTRLDAASIAFCLDHGDAKVVIVDREFAPTMAAALAMAEVKPLLIEVDDPEYAGPGDLLGGMAYEGAARGGGPGLSLAAARGRVGRDRAELHLRHDRGPERRRVPPPRGLPDRHRQHHGGEHRPAPGLSLDPADVPLQRLVLSRGPISIVAGTMSACGRCGPRRCTTIAAHGVTHLCGAPIVCRRCSTRRGEKRPLPPGGPSSPRPPPPEAVLGDAPGFDVTTSTA